MIECCIRVKPPGSRKVITQCITVQFDLFFSFCDDRNFFTNRSFIQKNQLTRTINTCMMIEGDEVICFN